MQAWGLLRPLWPLSQVEFTPRQGSEWCGFTPSEKQKKVRSQGAFRGSPLLLSAEKGLGTRLR